jgi:hypothetical protein
VLANGRALVGEKQPQRGGSEEAEVERGTNGGHDGLLSSSDPLMAVRPLV